MKLLKCISPRCTFFFYIFIVSCNVVIIRFSAFKKFRKIVLLSNPIFLSNPALISVIQVFCYVFFLLFFCNPIFFFVMMSRFMQTTILYQRILSQNRLCIEIIFEFTLTVKKRVCSSFKSTFRIKAYIPDGILFLLICYLTMLLSNHVTLLVLSETQMAEWLRNVS